MLIFDYQHISIKTAQKYFYFAQFCDKPNNGVSRIHPVETTNVSKIIFQCGVNLYHDENWYFVLHF